MSENRYSALYDCARENHQFYWMVKMVVRSLEKYFLETAPLLYLGCIWYYSTDLNGAKRQYHTQAMDESAAVSGEKKKCTFFLKAQN